MEDFIILVLDFIFAIAGNTAVKKVESKRLSTSINRKIEKFLSIDNLAFEVGCLLTSVAVLGFIYICCLSELVLYKIIGGFGMLYIAFWIFLPPAPPAVVQIEISPDEKSRSS